MATDVTGLSVCAVLHGFDDPGGVEPGAEAQLPYRFDRAGIDDVEARRRQRGLGKLTPVSFGLAFDADCPARTPTRTVYPPRSRQ